MLLRAIEILFYFSKLLHCSVEIRLAQHFISFTRHGKASMGKCIWCWWSAHTRPHKDVALRAEKEIALLVLPDIEKRASFAIFVYTQYYYNNFFTSSSFCTWHSRTDDESFSLYQIYIQSSVYLVIYLLLVNLISFFSPSVIFLLLLLQVLLRL